MATHMRRKWYGDFNVQTRKWCRWCVMLTVFMTLAPAVRSSTGTSCGKEGPCGPFQFCSATQGRCRDCDDDYCGPDEEMVDERFPTCRSFCLQKAAAAKIAERDKVIKAQEKHIDILKASVKAAAAQEQRIDNLSDYLKALGCLAGIFFVWAVVVTVLVVKDRRARKANAMQPNGEQREREDLLVVDTDLGGEAPVAEEDGYGTGNSVQSTPNNTLPRPLTASPDQAPDPAPVAAPVWVPHSTENGRNIHSPTNEDDNPACYVVLN